MSLNKIIEIKDLNAQFDDRKVLSDISLKIYENQITVILGGSGSGKTTLLKHIIGLYPVNEGIVEILGKNWNDLDQDEQKSLYLKMGVFYQNGALINSMTVGENVALPLQQHSGLSDDLIERLVRLKLSLVNIEYAMSLYPSQLSGGMLKRAALARAIAMDPLLLFCDEPGAGLDPVSLASLDTLIHNLKNQLGITVVLVTHEVPTIRQLADRIIFLEEGRVLYEGPFKEALNAGISSIDRFFQKDTQH